MEDIFTYIIVFGLLIGFSALYLFRKDNKRSFPLSVKQWGKYILTVSVVKQKRKVYAVKVALNYPVDEKGFFVEFIDGKRNIRSIPVTGLLQRVDKTSENEIAFSYLDFKKALKENRFRFGCYIKETNTKIKSHELTVSKHWNIYPVDSGKYN